ncbi:MAG: hypothetical protein KC635_16895, partial [Myxococcales bacterium]|nr:hypothetical protein [Myxococcales bacterium]
MRMVQLPGRSRAPGVSSLAVAAAFGLVVGVGACSGSALEGEATPSGDTAVDAVDTFVPTDTAVTTGDTEDVADTVDTRDATDTTDTTEPPVLDWESRSLGDTGVVSDVFAVSATEAYAVSGPRVLRYNGRGWATYGEPGPDALYGVWADESVVIVVGSGGAVARRAHGAARWELEATGSDADLHGVFARSPDDVWAAGDAATLVHWDGTAWSEAFTLDGIDLRSLFIVPGTTAEDGVLAVGTGGQLVSYQAGDWRAQQIASGTAVMNDIYGIDGTLFAVGTEATITVKKPGSNWQGQTTNDPRDRDLYAITGPAADDVVAFGAGGVVIRYDGQRWTTDTVTGPTFAAADMAAAAWAPSGSKDFYVAVGKAGGGLTLTNGQWVDLPTRPENGLRDIAGANAEALWGVGRGGLVVRRSDQGWSAVAVGVTDDLNAVDVAPGGIVWAVGANGLVLRIEDGAPMVIDTQLPLELFDVVATATSVTVCGKGGTLLDVALDGTATTLLPSGASADLRAMVIGGDGALWLSGAVGTLLRAEGSA